ncbi:MAG: 2-oxoacid:ferredoxin oxidoreductase subunit beta [Candidatus Aminicenantaceae bacterium]
MKENSYHLHDPTWCPGCGIYGVFAALKKAAASLQIPPERMVIVTGIGCHGRLNNYFNAYGFHGLHGRALPVAAGIKLANSSLAVLAVSGDGDAYSIGVGHFIHANRRNVNITCIVVDNRVYALTQGQASPTSQKGYVSVSSPFGSKETPLDGPRLAIVSGGTFVARGFSGIPEHLTALIIEGMTHNGFSLIEVLSPCVTYNKINTYKWFKENIVNLDDDTDYSAKTRKKALEVLSDRSKIPIGLLYQEERPSFDDLSLPSDTPIVLTALDVDEKKLNAIMKDFE